MINLSTKMNRLFKLLLAITALCVLTVNCSNSFAQSSKHKGFHVIAFYHEYNDLAHISFVHDANKFFPEMARKYNFTYDSTKDWSKLNAEFLSKYQVVIFLDSRTEDPAQRKLIVVHLMGARRTRAERPISARSGSSGSIRRMAARPPPPPQLPALQGRSR